jgi:hypothetical protein
MAAKIISFGIQESRNPRHSIPKGQTAREITKLERDVKAYTRKHGKDEKIGRLANKAKKDIKKGHRGPWEFLRSGVASPYADRGGFRYLNKNTLH